MGLVWDAQDFLSVNRGQRIENVAVLGSYDKKLDTDDYYCC